MCVCYGFGYTRRGLATKRKTTSVSRREQRATVMLLWGGGDCGWVVFESDDCKINQFFNRFMGFIINWNSIDIHYGP